MTDLMDDQPDSATPCTCLVPGCGRKLYGRGYCKAHWKRWNRTGTPGPAQIRNYTKSKTGACSVDGCDRPHRSLGLCALHVRRYRVTGAPGPAHLLAERRPTCVSDDCDQPSTAYWGEHCPDHGRARAFERRFWSRVEVTGCCWLWTGDLTDLGYGRLRRDRALLRAHRLAYELLVGPIPDGLVLDHLCRIRRCVNPDHLEPVTQTENVTRANFHIQHSTARRAA